MIGAVRGPRAASLSFLVIAACAGHSSPRTAVSDYLTAEQQGRYDDAHALLTEADRDARPLDAYVAEHLSAGPVWLAVARRTTFTVGASRTQDDHERVSVHARHPDLKLVASAVPGIPTDVLTTSPDPAARMAAAVEATLDASRFPTVDESLTYAVRDEGGVWRVWLGLDRQDEVISLLATARAAVARKDDAAARQAWTEALAVAPDPGGVVPMLQEEALKGLAQPPAPPAEAAATP